jgi:DNA modification methylase
VWHAGLYGAQVAAGLAACDFDIRSQIIWAKQHFVLSRGDYHWQHETCWYAVRKSAKSGWVGGRKQSTLWQLENNGVIGNVGRERTWGHATQKPVECMRRPILNSSRPGDVIYDPFLGSGTAVIGAEMTGRICVGLELNPAYVDVIVRRWEAFTGGTAVLEATGQPFAKLARARRGDAVRAPSTKRGKTNVTRSS